MILSTTQSEGKKVKEWPLFICQTSPDCPNILPANNRLCVLAISGGLIHLKLMQCLYYYLVWIISVWTLRSWRPQKTISWICGALWLFIFFNDVIWKVYKFFSEICWKYITWRKKLKCQWLYCCPNLAEVLNYPLARLDTGSFAIVEFHIFNNSLLYSLSHSAILCSQN